MWDSLPARQFISLDKFSSKNLQIRISIGDQGILLPNGQYALSEFLMGIDNIRVDGFPLSSNNEIIVKVFPNPTSNEIFIQSTGLNNQILHYQLIDMQGKIVQTGQVSNARISLYSRPAGMYMLRLFDKNYVNIFFNKMLKL